MLIVILLIASFSLIQGLSPYFSFQLHYCRFQCVDPCEGTKEVDNPNGNAKNPTAYYWRDFHGIIPTDAYPLGNSLQNPQTYIGLAYDASKNGTFVTTIVEGLDYVYTVLNGNVTKITNNIQILCTNEPERMVWIKLSAKNLETIEGLSFVKGSIHKTKEEKVQHFVSKTFHCQVLYAGSGYDGVLEYVLLDGTNSTTENFMYLLYRTEEVEKDAKKNKNKPFLSHLYEYSIRPNSIIPSFYKQINIGSCSMICTNEGKGKEGKLKSNKKALTSMAYYWKPNDVFNEEEALQIGFDRGFDGDDKLYLAKGYIYIFNWFDVGVKKDFQFLITDGVMVTGDYDNYGIFSTNHPDKFQWIKTNSEGFEEIDNKTMIPGGETNNGTHTFAGRHSYKTADGNNTYYPGSIRILPTGAAIYAYSKFGGIFTDFEVLTFMDSKKKA